MGQPQLRKGQPDFIILIITLLLMGIGLVMVYSSSQVFAYMEYENSAYFIKKQAIWAVLGLIVMVFFMNFPYRILRKLVPLILFIIFILLLLVLAIGTKINGAQSWLNLGFMSIQPSEFAKLGIIIYLASVYSKKHEYIDDFKRGVLPPLLVVSGFFLLIYLQNDLGTGMTIVIFTIIVIYLSGAKFKHLFNLGTLSIAFFAFFTVSKEYRIVRFTSFWNPWDDPLGSDYQLRQSLLAIGNGNISGNGFGKSIQKYLYLPEAHTDFIISITAEEFGFMGILVILCLYLTLILRGLYISYRCPDLFGTLLGIGIISMIGIQALINIAVASGVAPITGITLPLMSYGGSSLLLTMASIGVLLNVTRYSHTN